MSDALGWEKGGQGAGSWRVTTDLCQVSFLGDGKCSNGDYGNGCNTRHTLKTAESHTLNQSIQWYISNI